MTPEHPTGLELRFERELASTNPDWKSEFPELLGGPRETREPRPAVRRTFPRRRPHPRKVGGA